MQSLIIQLVIHRSNHNTTTDQLESKVLLARHRGEWVIGGRELQRFDTDAAPSEILYHALREALTIMRGDGYAHGRKHTLLAWAIDGDGRMVGPVERRGTYQEFDACFSEMGVDLDMLLKEKP